MNNKIFAENTARFKFKEEGVRRMCAIFEEIKEEGAINRSKEVAIGLIKLGKNTLDEIAMITGVSIAEVEELKAECDKT